jgi:SAM-dependent methyltransferase
MDISQFELHARIEDVHWWFKARRELMLGVLQSYVPVRDNRLIAEIGCGTGGNLKFLQRYYRVIGVDVSPEAVRYTSGRVNCPVYLGDFRDRLSAMWADIDAVILADVLEHIDDDAGFLRDVVKSLKTGSIILLTVPAHMFMWSRHDVILGHRRRYSAGNLRSLWKDLEVEEVYFTPFACILFPAIALYRLFRRIGPDVHRSDLSMPPLWLNGLLYRIFSIESDLARLFPLPYGISYLSVLRKKA